MILSALGWLKSKSSIDTIVILQRINRMENRMSGEIQGLQDEVINLKTEVIELQREVVEEQVILDTLAKKLDDAVAGSDLAAVAVAVEEMKAARAGIAAARAALDEAGTRDAR